MQGCLKTSTLGCKVNRLAMMNKLGLSLVIGVMLLAIGCGPRSALDKLRSSAENGDANAQACLGDFYSVGNGVSSNRGTAMKWYRKAAEQGLPKAQKSLGLLCLEDDKAEAVKWFRKAAQQGDAGAELYLGASYYKGCGVIEDKVEAVRWIRKSAEQGYAEAQVILGKCYYNGIGVGKDVSEAMQWFRKAASQGMYEAENALGDCYTLSEGLLAYKVEAAKWYRKAAEHGLVEAQLNLGCCYRVGHGVMPDFVEAYKWLRLAGDAGNKRAVEMYSELAKKMTREQIGNALMLADDWQKKKKAKTAIKYYPAQ